MVDCCYLVLTGEPGEIGFSSCSHHILSFQQVPCVDNKEWLSLHALVLPWGTDSCCLLLSERLMLVGGFLFYFAPVSALGRSCVPEAWVFFCLLLVGALRWKVFSVPFPVVTGLCFLSMQAAVSKWVFLPLPLGADIFYFWLFFSGSVPLPGIISP